MQRMLTCLSGVFLCVAIYLAALVWFESHESARWQTEADARKALVADLWSKVAARKAKLQEVVARAAPPTEVNPKAAAIERRRGFVETHSPATFPASMRSICRPQR